MLYSWEGAFKNISLSFEIEERSAQIRMAMGSSLDVDSLLDVKCDAYLYYYLN